MTSDPAPDAALPVPPADGEPPRVAADTSPTWELELLISGAVIFALFQIPSAIGGAYDAVVPSLSFGPRLLASVLFWFANGAAIALIAGFVFHLIARAYWVALVGLNSVFPRGQRWERMKTGPMTTAMYREMLPPMQAMIARVDNVCSVVFAFAFTIVVLSVITTVSAALAICIAYLVSDRLLGGRGFMPIYIVLLVPLMLLPMVARMLDRPNDPPVPGSRRAHWVARLTRAHYRIQGFGAYGTMQTTLMTNFRPRVIIPVFTVFFTITMVAAVAMGFARDGILRYEASAYFLGTGPRAVQALHYESQWTDARYSLEEPSIPSDVITGPYVRLFVPWSPMRHDDAVRRACPALRPPGDDGFTLGREEAASDAAQSAVLACMARILAPRLDGQPIPASAFAFTEHTRSGRPGVVAYVALDSLAPGRHVLTVDRIPTERARRRGVKTTQYTIPFWR